MAEIQGHCDSRFDELKALFQKNLDSGDDLGASIVVNFEGQNVVDIWGGYADKEKTQPWKQDTIVNVWSSTKNITSLAVLMLIDRGLIDPDENVSKYWPDFAANGKENVKVRHLMSHSAGLSGWDDPVTVEDFCDVKKSTALLAAQPTFWEPGTVSGYHAVTMGQLLGELVRQTTGKSLTQFVAEDIAAPLGADFQIGALEKDWPRVSDVVPPAQSMSLAERTTAKGAEPSLVVKKTFLNPPMEPTFANTTVWRKAELGAANGHGNARSLNRILSTISLSGEVDGKRIVSEETINRIFKEQVFSTDLALGSPMRFGLGYGLGGDDTPMKWLPSGRVCFWGGWGGSMNIMDVDRKVTISYAMNQMAVTLLGAGRGHDYIVAAYKALGFGDLVE